MEHLVESHMGGFYISSDEPEFIEEYCSECGDSDFIMYSWPEGEMTNSLKEYFSVINMTNEEIEYYKSEGATRLDLIEMAIDSYNEDKYIVQELYEFNYITKKEMVKLNKVIYKAEKDQIVQVLDSYKAKILKK